MQGPGGHTDTAPGATISLRDAARQMGVSLKAARRAVRSGDIPAIPWGRTYRVLRVPFEALIGARGEANDRKEPAAKT